MPILSFDPATVNKSRTFHLSICYLVLVILMAGQSLLVQYLAGLNYTGFIVMDLAFATILAIVSNRRIFQTIAVLHFFFSVFCVSYASAMGMPPTLKSVLNGAGYLEGFGFKSLTSYIHIQWAIVLASFLYVQCFVANHIWKNFSVQALEFKYRKLILLFSVSVFMLSHINAYILQPFSHFSSSYVGDGDRFEPAQKRSLNYRAFLGTFLLELCSGSAFAPSGKAFPCVSTDFAGIPMPHHDFENIVFIQVESLDAELLDMEIEDQQVMPFLHSLLEHSILVYADGTKKLGSANSDYEIFNGVSALSDVLHYEHATSYPRSLIPCLANNERKMEVFHGLSSGYMNLRSAYKLQGFHEFHDRSEMKRNGFEPLPIWTGGVISDRDLFAYASSKLPESNFLHFIITMNMHFPEHVSFFYSDPLFKSSPRSAFLSLARSTDNAIKKYVEALPDKTLVAIWGDHRSYRKAGSGKIPFMIYVKGASCHFDGRHIQGLERCTMYYYFKTLFACDNSDNTICTKSIIR